MSETLLYLAVACSLFIEELDNTTRMNNCRQQLKMVVVPCKFGAMYSPCNSVREVSAWA